MLANFVTGQYSTLVCKDRASYYKGIKVKKKNKAPKDLQFLLSI